MGVSIGALIRNMKIAQAGSIIWLSIVEKLIVVFWASGGKYLPSGLILGMMNININLKSSQKLFSISTSDYFNPAVCVVLLLVYAAIFAAVGSWVSLRRDID